MRSAAFRRLRRSGVPAKPNNMASMAAAIGSG